MLLPFAVWPIIIEQLRHDVARNLTREVCRRTRRPLSLNASPSPKQTNKTLLFFRRTVSSAPRQKASCRFAPSMQNQRGSLLADTAPSGGRQKQ